MKIKVSKAEILKKLKVLSKMPRGAKISSKLSEQVFFSVEDNSVKIMVYDGREIISVININSIETEMGSENLFSMDLKLFLSIVNKLEKEIEIELEEKYIKIRSGKTRFEIYRSGLEEMWRGQDMPRVEKGDGIECRTDALRLKKIMESVIVSASEDRENRLLGVIKVKVSEKKIELSATDGYRASIVSQNIEEWIYEGEMECLLLKESIPIITEILGGGSVVKVMATDKAILFEVDDMTVIIRGRELGKYPDVKKLLNGEGERVLDINKKEWSNAIDGISNLGANLIKLESEGNTGKVTIAGESDVSKSYEVSGEVDVSVGGDVEEDMKMLFRNKLLIEGIKSVDSEKLEVRLKGPNDFITIRPCGDVEQVNIVLPCRSI